MNALASGTLLLVDDEGGILNALERIFISEGFQIHTALSGIEGVHVLEEHPEIDVIISDMRMPGMNGSEFFKITAQRWPNIKRILLTGYADINSAIAAINDGKINYYISKPWNNNDILNTVNTALDNKRLHDENQALHKLLECQNEELKILNSHLEDKVKERTLELHNSYLELQEMHRSAVQVFLAMQELHEGAHRGYCRRVASQVKLVAQALNLGEREVQTMYLAAMLHNLGKNGLPSQIRNKPFTKLTLREYNDFIRYPFLGSTVISAFPSLKEVANIILHHRERFDGRGYPDHLKGENIPLGARVISIVVDFNELQHGLIETFSYHAQWALRYIKEHRERYDPNVLLVFIKTINQLFDEDASLAEEVLTPDKLQPGMILSRELLSNNGFLFLIKGYKLTPEVIDKINLLDNIVVHVQKS